MSSDAINTYNARQFGDWDSFSIVDTRNLERLNTGDTLEIVKPKFNNKIYEVKLMDGFNKNRNFFKLKFTQNSTFFPNYFFLL